MRSLVVEAMVETGAVRCVLPDHVRRELGLSTTSRRLATYEDGRAEEVDMTQPVRIELERGTTYEDCLVQGEEVLIGQTSERS